VIGLARGLASLACCGAALLVLLLFKPALQAPFLVPKFAALEVTASIGVIAFALRRTVGRGLRWTGWITAGVAFVLVTGAVAAAIAATRPDGAPYAVAAIARWGGLFGLACGASVLDDAPGERRRLIETITIAAAAVAALGLLQHLDVAPFPIPVISKPGSTFGNRNGGAEAMAMAMPFGLAAAMGAKQRVVRSGMFVALALELLYLAVTRTRGAWLGGGCGLAMAVWLAKPRWSRASVAAGIVAVVAAGAAAALPGRFNPYDVGDRKRHSGVIQVLEEGLDSRSTALRTRFGLWRRSLSMVREYPWFGVGPGNWPVVFPRYAEPGATRDGVLSASLAPRQAHNDYLERAAETGLPGLAALGLLGAGAGVAVRRRLRTGDVDTRASAGAAGASMVALAVLSIASFPFEMPAPIALAGLALGMVAVDARRSEGSADDVAAHGAKVRPVAWAPAVIGLALLAGAVVRAERSVRSSRWLGAAERAMSREAEEGGASTDEAWDALNHALAVEPQDFRAQLRMAQVLVREHRSVEASRAALRALDLEPYSPNAWGALAAAELDSGDYEAAQRDATKGLTLLSDYPLGLDVRSKAAEKLGHTVTAQADRARLGDLAADPSNNHTAREARALLSTGR